MHVATLGYRAKRRRLREREQLLRQELAAVVLGDQLPAPGRNQKEIRSRRAVLRPPRSGLRTMEHRRLHETVSQAGDAIDAWMCPIRHPLAPRIITNERRCRGPASRR